MRNVYGRTMSKDDIIRTAACHVCCARLGDPCLFNREEDPEGKRRIARDSHDKRVLMAKERWGETLDLSGITL